MRLAPLFFGALAFSLALAGCGEDTSSSTGDPPGPEAPDDGLPASCNPLRTAGACLLPYPSSVFTKDDAATATGERLDVTGELFPVNVENTSFDPARLGRLDGFPPSTQILAYFPERIDGASLPPLADPDASLAETSTTVIVDMTTGERVAHFAEVDAQATKEDDRQVLILRPMQRLANAHRYAVGITSGLRTVDGERPSAPVGWDAVLDGTTTSARGKRQSARMPDILAALDEAGVARDDLLVAWDFVTSSEEASIGALLSMREQTIAAMETEELAYTIDNIEDDFSPHALRRITGTFEVPRFISETALNVPDASLTFDGDGKPVRDGNLEAPFTLILPRAAEQAPVHLLVFGHGFLGTARGELGGPGGSHVQTFLDEKGYAAIGTDWSGLSAYEGIDADGSQAAALAVRDMNHFQWIGDRLAQSLMNATVLARIARDQIAKDPLTFVETGPTIDSSRVDYYGISLGGVMGSVLVGLSPDIDRAALNVGAAGWTTLLQRSTNWQLFKLILDGSYPDRLDQQVLICVLQTYMDLADGTNLAAHLATDPLPGNAKKQVLLQIAVGDPSVSNVAAEMYARAAGFPVLDSAPKDVWGIAPAPGPLPSALSIFDTKEKDQPPIGNLPTSVTADNDCHNSLRDYPAVQAQIDAFLRSGEVVSTCDGKCDPE